MRSRDWAKAYGRPTVAEATWSRDLEATLGEELRGDVVRRVRSENAVALVRGIVATLIACALAVAFLLLLGKVLHLPPIPYALITAAVTLGVTIVAGRWFRRIHAGQRYAARVLEVHRAFMNEARNAARPLLEGRRAA